MLLSTCSASTRSRRVHWGCMLLLLLSPTLVMAQSPLVLHLPFEDAVNPIDASANPTTVVVHGTLNSTDGQFGAKGLEFDGNNANRVEVTDAAKLDGMSALTIEAWVLARNAASHEGMSIVSKRNAFNDGDAYNLFIWTNQLVNGRVNGNNSSVGLSTTAIEDDTWYHIALVFDGQGDAGEKIKLYINGVLESSDGHPSNAVNEGTAPVWIGELDAARGFAWDGVMDEVGIWNIALSEDQINRLMVQTKTEMLKFPSGPDPADGALHPATWVNLGWSAGDSAVSHDVYLGDNFDEVDNDDNTGATFRGGHSTATLFVGFFGAPYPDGLVPGTTYYWRVDEVDPTNTYKGDVWSFWIPPTTAYEPSPSDGSRFVHTDVTFNWTAGLDTKFHYVHFGDNFDDVNNAAVDTGTPVGATTSISI